MDGRPWTLTALFYQAVMFPYFLGATELFALLFFLEKKQIVPIAIYCEQVEQYTI